MGAFVTEQLAEEKTAFEQIQRGMTVYSGLPMQPVSISTMTFGGRLSHHPDLDAVRALDFSSSPLRLSGRTAKGDKPFGNQVTLLHPRAGHDKVCSVLLFGNGSITVAGCKGAGDFGMVVESLCRLLEAVVPGVVVVRSDIIMLNAHLKLDVRLALFKVNDRMMDLPGVHSGFNPMTYHGVTVKHPLPNGHKMSFSIFQSGSVLMTVKTYGELALAHRFICSTVHASLGELTVV